MKHKIIFQNTAIRSLERIYAYISKDNPAHAQRYLKRLRAKCQTLANNPKRCPEAFENGLGGMDIRHLIFDQYRVIFTVVGLTVHVLEIRHAARLPIGKETDGD